jgi:hypothetical protein
MFRKQLVIVLSLCLALVFAPAAAVAENGDWTKRISGQVSSASVLEFDTPKCGAFPKSVIEGVGETNRTGLVVATQSHCLNPDSGELFDGEYTLMDVNGDAIYGTYTAQSVPTVDCPDIANGDCRLIGYGHYTIDGGTGRYAGVTGGGGPARVITDSATGQSELYFGGVIQAEGAIKPAS